MIKLTVNRKGSFTVSDLTKSRVQCGVVGKTRTYEYEVSICATDMRLIEPDGFVIDNAIVDDYFKNKYDGKKMVCKSCEVMACEAIENFKGYFIGDKALYPFIDLQDIKVVLHGSPFSFITGHWQK